MPASSSGSNGNRRPAGTELTSEDPAWFEWTIHIDTATLEPYDDPATPFRGIVRSTWRVNGRPVIPQGDISGLPLWVLETGVSQDCWAFWEAEPKLWSWL